MKRIFTAAALIATLAVLYLISYCFSGVTVGPTNPNSASLTVFGIPLPSTPTVFSAYNAFYWPLRRHTANQKPTKTITGEIRALDYSQRLLIVAPTSGQSIGCAFTPTHDSNLRNLKRGDMVTASIGYVPDPKYPSSWSYTLLSVAPTQ